ncbi:MAG: type II toxin-antitoxin system HicB family antitoxin [Lactobacillaceae bacterium]|jgi:predicted RNase H-like HicB family nuclease|nr:type II toxin-antitoxin system HicB family antitoxin [Lactobacillaceae bacterium]
MTTNNLLFYPTVFSHEDGSINVRVPDVGVATVGTDMQDALYMVRDALGLMLESETSYPDPSEPKNIQLEPWEIADTTEIVMVAYDLAEYRKSVAKTVRRNISLPEYLNNAAKKANINVSKVATEALEEVLYG